MKNLNTMFENEKNIYGYYTSESKFIPYNDSKCKKINCIYCKETKKVYGI